MSGRGKLENKDNAGQTVLSNLWFGADGLGVFLLRLPIAAWRSNKDSLAFAAVQCYSVFCVTAFSVEPDGTIYLSYGCRISKCISLEFGK